MTTDFDFDAIVEGDEFLYEPDGYGRPVLFRAQYDAVSCRVLLSSAGRRTGVEATVVDPNPKGVVLPPGSPILKVGDAKFVLRRANDEAAEKPVPRDTSMPHARNLAAGDRFTALDSVGVVWTVEVDALVVRSGWTPGSVMVELTLSRVGEGGSTPEGVGMRYCRLPEPGGPQKLVLAGGAYVRTLDREATA